MKVIIDAEFNGLQPDKIWCIVCKDIDNGEIHRFYGGNLNDFSGFASSVRVWVGHNIIGFDLANIKKLLNVNIDPKKCVDTLIVSRLINYNKPRGHSVENWGRQFGMTKKFIKEWDDPNLINDYLVRCEYDVEIQYRIYKELEKYIKDPDWAKAMRVEHDLQIICQDMHENGFAFDAEEAQRLLSQIKEEMAELEEQIRNDIPPVLHQDGPIKLKVNKDGTLSSNTRKWVDDSNSNRVCVCDGGEYYRFHYEPFNPGSPKQRIAYLNSAGWNPTEKTKGHLKCEREVRAVQNKINRLPKQLRKKKEQELKELQERLEGFRETGWKVNETNLDTLPSTAPKGARLLAKWLTLEGRRGDLVEWLDAYSSTSGRIHGSFNGIGSWPHRMSHVRPNQGNIFSNFTASQCKGDEPTGVEEVKIRYNGTLRSLWRAGDDRLLVGTDAEGIQMRILAHYINDPEYTDAIVRGRKEDGTDVHNLNRRKLGAVCRSRDDAKTFIYAWILGASNRKVSEILGCKVGHAKEAVDLFIGDTPGLAELKRHRIPADARRGYFDGLDGRKVICRSEHLMLAGYLQNGEKCVMAHANRLWRKWLDEEGIPYWQVDFVHDEWVTETVNDMEVATRIGELQAKSIEEVGKELGLNCALAGEYKIGKNWLQVH